MIMAHPNIGPYVSTQLIRALVTSNPSPAYVGRVAAIFNNNGSGVKGDLDGGRPAIVTDAEALAGSANPTSACCATRPCTRSRFLRGLGAQGRERHRRPDGVLAPQVANLGQNVFNPDTVFGYYPAENELPGYPALVGPEFGIQSALTALRRANLVNTLVYSNIATGANNPFGTSLDLSAIQTLAARPGRDGGRAEPAPLPRPPVRGREGRDRHRRQRRSRRRARASARSRRPTSSPRLPSSRSRGEHDDSPRLPPHLRVRRRSGSPPSSRASSFGLLAQRRAGRRRRTRTRRSSASSCSGATTRTTWSSPSRERLAGYTAYAAARGASLAIAAARGHGLRGRPPEPRPQLRPPSRDGRAQGALRRGQPRGRHERRGR